MRLLSRTHTRLDLRPNEGRPVRLLVTLSFSQGLALVMADTAATALFLSALGAAALPEVYLAAAVVVPLVGASIGWLGQRIPTERLAVGSFLALAILMLLLWGGSALGTWVFFLLLLWYRVFNAISGVIFWGLAGRLLNLRQAKRLYGLVGSGKNVARVLGYAMIPLLAALDREPPFRQRHHARQVG
jgi:ATP:ADP antiporter, AAA family